MWYFVKDGTQQGPVSDEQLRSMARDGSLKGEDLVWQEGMPDWRPAMEVPGIEFRRELPQELPTMPMAVAPPPPPPAPQFEPEPHRMQTPPIQSPSMQTPPLQTPPVTGPGATPYAPPTAHLGSGAGADIPNYLPWAIVATLFCCLPLGIVSIIFASKANSAKAMGDLAAARQAAGQAKTWLMVTVGLGLLGVLTYVVFMVIGIVSGMAQQ